MAAARGSETTPVFGHGQLRLYLLAVLEEGPRSGYDVIRGLEDRFGGLYSPSAGTVYPRLAKLEEESLITRSDQGRRSTYALTDAGREELERRRDELAALEQSLDESAQRLAEQMRERVRSGTADVRARLEEAARQARARAGGPFRSTGSSSGGSQDVPGGASAGAAGAGSAAPTGPGPAGEKPNASGAGSTWGGQTWGGSGPFVPPGFGAGFPFGQGGTPDWATVARWLREFGITPPTGMPGERSPWSSWGTQGSSGPSRTSGSQPGASTGRRGADDVWAQATDHPDDGASGASGRPGSVGDAGSAGGVWAQATDRPPEQSPDDAGGPQAAPTAAQTAGAQEETAGAADPHDTGTGWPGAPGVPHATVPHAPGPPSSLPGEPMTVPEAPWQHDDSDGGRRSREWDDFLGGSMPDAGQLREVAQIIRDAAARIQAVLSRTDPGQGRDRRS